MKRGVVEKDYEKMILSLEQSVSELRGWLVEHHVTLDVMGVRGVMHEIDRLLSELAKARRAKRRAEIAADSKGQRTGRPRRSI